MCYSARIWHDYRRYVRAFGADVSLADFVDLFWRRVQDGASKVKVAKALEGAFADPQSDEERQVAALIAEFAAGEATRLEQELFKQRTRLVAAERELQTKVTKKATDHRRIAGTKIEQCLRRLGDLRRGELLDEDARIFPGYFAPVLVVEDGRRVVKPMRYQCRPAGKPAFNDTKFPGTYNARVDNLEGFWKPLFGRTHGLVVVDAFYENVARHRLEGRDLRDGEADENVILEFEPRPRAPMLAACLWSRWTAPGQPDLLSFAAITDEPPPAIAAAGHDRCIVPIKEEHVEAWLNPDPRDLKRLYAILADRERPDYAYRLAA